MPFTDYPLTKWDVYVKKTSINSIGIYVFPKDTTQVDAKTYLGEVSALNHHEAVNEAFQRLIVKF
jgi:hypothetical protein